MNNNIAHTLVLAILGFFLPICAQDECPMVIVVPSYNNSEWCERNLYSVFEQMYKNFIVIYIDDCSTDDTYTKVANAIKEHNWADHAILIHNHQRHGALENLYKAIVACDDRAIIITVDGDDWLAHAGVLAYLNQEYQNPFIWMTWGQYSEHPSGSVGFCRDFSGAERQFALYRDCWMPVSHLRTFYAGLFKKINPDDLKKDGRFYSMSWDKAMMGPMLEMAAGKFKWISEILYVYNNSNPLNDHRIDMDLQHTLMHEILAKPKYEPLDQADFITTDFVSVLECCPKSSIEKIFNDGSDISYSVNLTVEN